MNLIMFVIAGFAGLVCVDKHWWPGVWIAGVMACTSLCAGATQTILRAIQELPR